MKTQIIFIILAIITSFSANSATISISKQSSNDPLDVCNNSILFYTDSITGAPSGYTVSWITTNAQIQSQSTTQAEVKWISDSESDGYVGTIKAQLKNSSGNVIAESNTITVTIKSIKHLKPEIIAINPNLTISPCQSGQISLEVTRLEVPGTGILNPEKVNDYLWTLPSGWTMSGYTSNGSTEIPGNYYVTVSYPASATGGTIKVRGYHSVSGCGDGMQFSKSSDIITVTRDVSWSLTSSKSSFLCGDTNPITFTLTPSTSLNCAVYYWNNSTIPTTSNTFQVIPGNSDVIVTVKAVYGGKEAIKNITVPVKMYEGVAPTISGPSLVCSSGSSFSINNLPSVDSIIWIPGDNLTVYSGQNTPSAVIKATGNGVTGLNVRLVNACGEITLSQYLWAGTPVIIGLDGPTSVPTNEDTRYYPLYGYQIASPTDFEWNVTPDAYYNSYGWSTLVNFPSPDVYHIIYRGLNTCGWGNWYMSGNIYVYSSRSLSFTPNPTSGETILSIETSDKKSTSTAETEETAFDETAEWSLEVYDNVQSLKMKKTSLKGRETTINTRSWKDGVYFVRVLYKNEVLKEKLVVKK